jgi:hypothetical protein
VTGKPPDTRGNGPAALPATARWLRSAFSDLSFQVHDTAHQHDLVVVDAVAPVGVGSRLNSLRMPSRWPVNVRTLRR